jgi:hypothetical protein
VRSCWRTLQASGVLRCALLGSMLACSVSCVTIREAHWAGHMQVPEVYAPFDVNISTRQLAGVREDTARMGRSLKFYHRCLCRFPGGTCRSDSMTSRLLLTGQGSWRGTAALLKAVLLHPASSMICRRDTFIEQTTYWPGPSYTRNAIRAASPATD